MQCLAQTLRIFFLHESPENRPSTNIHFKYLTFLFLSNALTRNHYLADTKTMNFKASITKLLITIAIAVIFTGCSEATMSGSSKIRKQDPAPCCVPPPKPLDAQTFDHAVFAVRDLGCAMCHAKVESNIVTDFMNGGSALTTHQALESWTYMLHLQKRDNFAHDPAPEISGRIIVPKAQLSQDKSPLLKGSPGRCDTYIKTTDAQKTMTAATATVDLKQVLDRCVTPHVKWGASSEKIQVRDTVHIAPPTSAQEIMSIASKSGLLPVSGGVTPLRSFEALALNSTNPSQWPMATQSGFNTTPARPGAVVVTGEASCDGALLIDAPLFFNNAKIKTSTGCRIYTTASIFVKGSLEIVNTGATDGSRADLASLMLMSPDFIGFHIPLAQVEDRLGHGINKLKTFTKGTTAAIAAKIKSDAVKVNYPAFTDAEANGTGAAISYNRIVATAPVVYSRMTGSFSGAIIAEHFMGKIGALSFTFDQVFDRAPFFPEFIINVRDGRSFVGTANNSN